MNRSACGCGGAPVESMAILNGNESVEGILSGVLTYLQYLRFLHQTNHWNASGSVSYSDHLMFQRLYEGVEDEIDSAAEKLLGYVKHPGGMRVDSQVGALSALSALFPESIPMTSRSYLAELVFLDVLEHFSQLARDSGKSTVGIDDFLASLSDAHETNLYLLKQRVKTSGEIPLSAESYFVDQPRYSDVLSMAESEAPTNDPAVAKHLIKNDQVLESPKKVMRQVDESPLTTDEIMALPGAKDFATLNRYVLDTTKVRGGR